MRIAQSLWRVHLTEPIGASEVEAMAAGTQIGLLIREDVGFAEGAGGRVKD